METNPLDRQATARGLRILAQSGRLHQSALERALVIIGQIPSTDRWRSFLNLVLLVLGATCTISGIVFFFAYNWADLPAFAKLGLIEALLLLAVGLAHYLDLGTLAGKTALVVAAVLVGVLQAVYGQIYQTGADSHQLFFGWAILIFGWALASSHAPLWFLVLVLLNLGLGSYLRVGTRSGAELSAALFALNAIALFAWEYAHQRGIAWLSARWPIRLLACAAFGCVVALMLDLLFNQLFSDQPWPLLLAMAPVMYASFVGVVLFVYSRRMIDLFILTIAALSLVIVITSTLARLSFNNVSDLNGAFNALLIGGAIVVQMTVAFYWLQSVARLRKDVP